MLHNHTNLRFPERPRVYVDWKAYGICAYFMLGGVKRCYSWQKTGTCRFVHPPEGEVSRLWEQPQARLQYATKVPREHPQAQDVFLGGPYGPYGPSRVTQPPTPPPPPPASEPQLLLVTREQMSEGMLRRPGGGQGFYGAYDALPPPASAGYGSIGAQEGQGPYGSTWIPPPPPVTCPSVGAHDGGFGLYVSNRAPPPPDHPVNEPRSIFERIERPQIAASEQKQQRPEVRESVQKRKTRFDQEPQNVQRNVTGSSQQTPVPEVKFEAQQDTQTKDVTRTEPSASGKNHREQGATSFSFGTTSIDAPASPKPEAAHNSVKQKPGKETPAMAKGRSANKEPLGKPNRLFQRADSVQNSSPVPALSQDVPTAAAHSIWKRADSENAQQAQESHAMNVDEPPRRQSGYWAKRRAKSAAGKEEGDGQKANSDVQAVQSRPKAQPKAATQAKPPRDGVDVKMPPLPPPPRTALPAASYASTSPPPTAKAPSIPTMGATKRLSNGEPKPPIGPHPSTIRVAAPYTTQASIEKRLLPPGLDHQERSLAEAREDANRLQGVTWLDNVRRALQLPIRTLTTACGLYHKFRLTHPGAEYAFADAAAASLLAACKIEDTLKKSRDILAAAYNLKLSSHDALSADDVIFEAPGRVVIGLERLVLEAGGFDFRSKDKHKVLVKIAKSLPDSRDKKDVGEVAWTVLTDLHRTFAVIKHTTATQAIACIELAAHLHAATSDSSVVREHVQKLNVGKWSTNRENIMETLLDLLDLYTHHTTSTILGTKYSLEDFLRIRLALNKECSELNIPRYQSAPESAADRPAVNGTTIQVANGHPTPVSPPQPGAQLPQPNIVGVPPVPEGGGTLRFILNPQLAADEKGEVQKYFVEEWEEYQEEIEVPLPRPPKSPSRDHEREREPTRDRQRDRPAARESETRAAPPPPRAKDRDLDRRSDTDDRRSVDDRRAIDTKRSREDLRDRDRERDRDRDRDRERDRLRERDREVERDRARLRDRDRERDRERDRDRRYDDRRYDERDRYDRRDRDRRYDDYDRRRDRR